MKDINLTTNLKNQRIIHLSQVRLYLTTVNKMSTCLFIAYRWWKLWKHEGFKIFIYDSKSLPESREIIVNCFMSLLYMKSKLDGW